MFGKLFAKQAAPVKKDIVVVSGLPRSGTSMMMKMLEAGGLAVVSDAMRTADRDNPNGYYELEAVKQMSAGQTAWLREAGGKAVKVISALLEFLPADYHYKVIFMERAMEEVLASQQKMLANRQEQGGAGDVQMREEFEKHLAAAKYWLPRQPNIEVLYVDYNRMMADPGTSCRRVAAFLGMEMDEEKMRGVPDGKLYRNRAGRAL
ncbi:MAG TPA: sulfotransferase [Anaerolineales bacterium]